jgi:hypothetical protein
MKGLTTEACPKNSRSFMKFSGIKHCKLYSLMCAKFDNQKVHHNMILKQQVQYLLLFLASVFLLAFFVCACVCGLDKSELLLLFLTTKKKETWILGDTDSQ